MSAYEDMTAELDRPESERQKDGREPSHAEFPHVEYPGFCHVCGV